MKKVPKTRKGKSSEDMGKHERGRKENIKPWAGGRGGKGIRQHGQGLPPRSEILRQKKKRTEALGEQGKKKENQNCKRKKKKPRKNQQTKWSPSRGSPIGKKNEQKKKKHEMSLGGTEEKGGRGIGTETREGLRVASGERQNRGTRFGGAIKFKTTREGLGIRF